MNKNFDAHASQGGDEIKLRRIIAIVSAILSVVLGVITLYITALYPELDSLLKTVLLSGSSAFIGISSAFIGFYLFSIFLLDKPNSASPDIAADVSQILANYIDNKSILKDCQFGNLIGNASEIDFVVQGWDRWTERDNIYDSLKNFFSRGGEFRLYITDPDKNEASYSRSMMEKRLNRTPHLVEKEINGTFESLKDIIDGHAIDAGLIKCFKTTALNWYFAARFIGRTNSSGHKHRDVIVFSIYSHTQFTPWHLPSILVYPDDHTDLNLEGWFDKELKHIINHSTESVYRYDSNFKANEVV